MRLFAIFIIAAVGALASTSASAQDDSGQARSIKIDGSTFGIVATTPSRIPASRDEMNRGRVTSWAINPTPAQLRNFAERSLRRGGFHCTVEEVEMVAQLLDGTPIVEVACEEDGGVVIADSDPIQFSDCFDLVGATGAIGPCRIPKNVAIVNASRQ